MAVSIEANAGADAMLRSLGLDHPAGWESFAAGEPVNETGRGFVRRFRWPAGNGEVFYFKLYRLNRRWKRFRSIFRPDPARRESSNLSFLRTRGIAAVEPVAWGCARRLGVVRASFLLTRGESKLETLERLLPLGPARRPWIAALARFVRNMHDAGFFAHDLHFRNLLAGPGAGGEPAFMLLDLPNGRRLAEGDPRRVEALVYDLASLDRNAAERLSRTDRLRFLRAYVAPERIDRDLLLAIERRRLHQVGKHARALLIRRAGEG